MKPDREGDPIVKNIVRRVRSTPGLWSVWVPTILLPDGGVIGKLHYFWAFTAALAFAVSRPVQPVDLGSAWTIRTRT